MQNQHYDFSVPIFTKMLQSVLHLLDVASELAKGRPEGEKSILEARLAPDMFPFVKQVQIACDNAKGASARLAGVEIPSFPDTETSIAELRTRVENTILFLESLAPEKFSDAGTRKIELKYFPNQHMLGDGYLKQYALPNFFFHVTTMYDILRKEGAVIGKGDFIHGAPLIVN